MASRILSIVPTLPIERPPHQPAKGVRISNLAVSALASLIPVDRRLDGAFRLKTGRGVFGLGVVIAPTAQFVGIALEMRVHVTRHQFVAPLRRGPVRPVVRQQKDAAEATVRTFPQSLEMADAIAWRPDAGEA